MIHCLISAVLFLRLDRKNRMCQMCILYLVRLFTRIKFSLFKNNSSMHFIFKLLFKHKTEISSKFITLASQTIITISFSIKIFFFFQPTHRLLIYKQVLEVSEKVKLRQINCSYFVLAFTLTMTHTFLVRQFLIVCQKLDNPIET